MAVQVGLHLGVQGEEHETAGQQQSVERTVAGMMAIMAAAEEDGSAGGAPGENQVVSFGAFRTVLLTAGGHGHLVRRRARANWKAARAATNAVLFANRAREAAQKSLEQPQPQPQHHEENWSGML